MTKDKPTLLFVDDESRILRTMEMAFRRDYHLLTTTDGGKPLSFSDSTGSMSSSPISACL